MEIVARWPWLATRTRFSSSWLRYVWNGRVAGESKKTLKTLMPGGRSAGASTSADQQKSDGVGVFDQGVREAHRVGRRFPSSE